MKLLIVLFGVLIFQVTLTIPAPLESKFPATFGFSFQNQRRGPPPPIGPTRPEPVPVGLLDDQVPAVKIVENYSVTNVERNQDDNLIELLNILHELPPNETLSGVNQRISTSTESVIEILDKLRQETTTTTATTTTTTAPTTTATSSLFSTETTEPSATSDPTDPTTILDSIPSTTTTTTATTTSMHKRPLLKDGERPKNVFAQVSKPNSLNETISQEEQLLADDHQDEDQVLLTDPDVDQPEVTTQAEDVDLSDLHKTGLEPHPDESGLPEPHQDVAAELDINITLPSGSGLLDQEPELITTTTTTTTISTTAVTTTTSATTSTSRTTEAATMTSTTPTTTTTSSTSPDDEEEIENEETFDDSSLTSAGGKCFNSSDASSSCAEDDHNNGIDVVLIAGVTVGVIVCVVIVAATVAVWFCRKSHHRKNVYATMEEEQPKEFTKAGPPVILQDELVNSGHHNCGSRYHFRNSDKVTEL